MAQLCTHPDPAGNRYHSLLAQSRHGYPSPTLGPPATPSTRLLSPTDLSDMPLHELMALLASI
jgi:hypothetical protein